MSSYPPQRPISTGPGQQQRVPAPGTTITPSTSVHQVQQRAIPPHQHPSRGASQQQQYPKAQQYQYPTSPAANHRPKIPVSLQKNIGKKPRQFYGVCKLDRYKIIKQLGKGTFGIVYKGIHKETGYYVAIKKILIHKGADCFPVTAFREIDILKNLQGPGCKNIIELIEMIHDRPPPNDDYTNYDSSKASKGVKKSFYMVFPYMSYDLSGILGNPSVNLTESDIKSIMKQLLDGINFIHGKKYLHRDIKAANILINWEGVLKIGDFGLARAYGGPRPTEDRPGGGLYPLTEVVMTRWYRAPEVLFGDVKYTTAVDIWGIGCVFGELYERKPILPGKSDLAQAYDIFNLVGEANENTVSDMSRYKFHEKTIKLRPTKRTLEERFSKLISPEGVDLLGKMLLLDPERRITGLSALNHPFFHVQPLPTETVDVNFPECHEADIARFKEEQNMKKNNIVGVNNNNGFNKPYPNDLPPSVPNIPGQGPPINNGIAKPKTAFIKSQKEGPRRYNDHSNRYAQRPAHPQDLETPPPAPQHGAYYQSDNSNIDQQGYGRSNANRYGSNAPAGYTRRPKYDTTAGSAMISQPASRRPPQQPNAHFQTQVFSGPHEQQPQQQHSIQQHHTYSHGSEARPGGGRYPVNYEAEDANGYWKNGGYHNSPQGYRPTGPRGGERRDRGDIRDSDRGPPGRSQRSYPQYNDRQKQYHLPSKEETREPDNRKRQKVEDDNTVDY